MVAGGERRLDVPHIMIELIQQIGSGLRDALAGDAMRPQCDNLRPLEDERGARRQGVVDGHHRRQNFVLDIDQRQRAKRRLLVVGNHRRDQIAVIAHLVDRENGLILDAHAVDGIEPLEVFAGDDGVNAGSLRGARGIDSADARVRVRAAQDLGVQHARQ